MLRSVADRSISDSRAVAPTVDLLRASYCPSVELEVEKSMHALTFWNRGICWE
jgi:hypothetical protein